MVGRNINFHRRYGIGVLIFSIPRLPLYAPQIWRLGSKGSRMEGDKVKPAGFGHSIREVKGVHCETISQFHPHELVPLRAFMFGINILIVEPKL